MRAWSIGLFVALGLVVETARAAPDRAACLSAYEDVQVQSRSAALLRARESALVCSRAPCPAALQPECARWLADIERRIPSIVVTLKRAKGEDVANAKVYLDDRLVASRLEGRPIELDPGEHTIRVEAEGRPTQTTIVAAENVKGRNVALAEVDRPVGSEKASDVGRPPVTLEKRMPVLGWVALGIGAAGLATFGAFALVGESKYGDLEGCRPDCASSDVSQTRTFYAIADVGLAVGVVSLATAAVLWLTAPRVPTTARSPAIQNPRFAFSTWK